jgi:hypothetical protein
MLMQLHVDLKQKRTDQDVNPLHHPALPREATSTRLAMLPQLKHHYETWHKPFLGACWLVAFL